MFLFTIKRVVKYFVRVNIFVASLTNCHKYTKFHSTYWFYSHLPFLLLHICFNSFLFWRYLFLLSSLLLIVISIFLLYFSRLLPSNTLHQTNLDFVYFFFCINSFNTCSTISSILSTFVQYLVFFRTLKIIFFLYHFLIIICDFLIF